MVDRRIAVAPSMTLAIALSAAHVAAAGLLWLVPIPQLGKAGVTLAIAASLIYFMARDALLHAPHSIVTLEFRSNGEMSLQTRRGDWIDGDLLGSSYVSPRLTVVNVRPRGSLAARHVILVTDNVDPRDFRHLRTWLRWKRSDRSTPAAAEER